MTNTAAEHYDDLRDLIEQEIVRLHENLDMFVPQQRPINYGDCGSLSKVLNELQEINAHLKNKEA